MQLKDLELASVNTSISEYDWQEILRGDAGYRLWPSGELTELRPTAESIDSLLIGVGHCECQSEGFCGSYCDDSYRGIVILKDGTYAAFEAWNDTTGWGCRDGVEWGLATTLETVWNFALSDEGRSELEQHGFTL